MATHDSPSDKNFPPIMLLLGPSAGGKTAALSWYAQWGFTTMDDVPWSALDTLLPSWIEAQNKGTSEGKPLALAVGSWPLPSSAPSSGETLPLDVVERLKSLKETLGAQVQWVWLEAPPPVLAIRWAERNDPSPWLHIASGQMVEAMMAESQYLAPLRKLHDYALDTASIQKEEARLKLAKVSQVSLSEEPPFSLQVMSFAYKKGLPPEADLVMDARFLTNPFYVDPLRPMTGLDQPVQDYLFQFEETGRFVDHWSMMIRDLLPHYRAQGKLRLTVAFGCTGGKHRSVCLAESFAQTLDRLEPDLRVSVVHRERASWDVQSPSPKAEGSP